MLQYMKLLDDYCGRMKKRENKLDDFGGSKLYITMRFH